MLFLKKNWFEAMEICKIKRMELVAVDSEKKQKEIQNYIESFNYKERNYLKIKNNNKNIIKILTCRF